MRLRTALSLVLAAALAAGAVSPAEAKSKKKRKPITKEYDLTLTPLPFAEGLSQDACSAEQRTPGQDMDVRSLKVFGPGKLTLEVSGFYGDWDASVWTAGGIQGSADGTTTPDNMSTPAGEVTDTLTYKSKKAQTLTIRVCNFFGTTDGHVKYTYTYS